MSVDGMRGPSAGTTRNVAATSGRAIVLRIDITVFSAFESPIYQPTHRPESYPSTVKTL